MFLMKCEDEEENIYSKITNLRCGTLFNIMLAFMVCACMTIFGWPLVP